MNIFLKEFKFLLYEEKKFQSLNLVLEKLKKEYIGIVDLYSNILSPALNNMICVGSKESCIWKEHIRSSIIRTIIENCYPYVINEKTNKYKLSNMGKVLVICPPEEYHELGARMATDFFELAGYDPVFIGANTPKKDFIDSINVLDPKYIFIRVTNTYNLFSTKDTINKIKSINPQVKILVGGYAFDINKELYKEVSANYYIKDFQDILNLSKEDSK
ncbi:MAG: B12-binding domain-containing protein [Clostridiaceae bacterium]